jgi:hypothetical protein
MKNLFYYFLGLLTWMVLILLLLKYAPESAKYAFFDVVDVEVTIEYE